MLIDNYGRIARNLRISITDRCNFRCIYCMPKDPHWLPNSEILTFEEIIRLAQVAVSLGVEKIRLTGGEPTARKDCVALVRMFSHLEGLKDLSLTTNGMLLTKLAKELWSAGLRRINVSLDTLDSGKFVHIARRDAFRDVAAGLEEAERIGFRPLKVNMVVIRGFNDDEVVEFAKLSRTKPYHIRFIEFMPLDGDDIWDRNKVVPAAEIIEKIAEVCNVVPVPVNPQDPSKVYRFTDGIGEIGIIASVSDPFCLSCDRIRLTADGKLRTCLFTHWETDLKTPMRNGASDEELGRLMTEAVSKKDEGHLINSPAFKKPDRAMYAIGG